MPFAWRWGHDSDLRAHQLCGSGISDRFQLVMGGTPNSWSVFFRENPMNWGYPHGKEASTDRKLGQNQCVSPEVSNFVDWMWLWLIPPCARSQFMAWSIRRMASRYCFLWFVSGRYYKPHPDLWPGSVRKLIQHQLFAPDSRSMIFFWVQSF